MSSEKPFWKSKKFVYALATFIAALVLALLPSVVGTLEPATVEMLQEMLPKLLIIGGLLITGHTATDLLYTWTEKLTPTDLVTAAHDLINALPLDDLVKLMAKEQAGSPVTQAGGTVALTGDITTASFSDAIK